ncbi:MAG TPA: glycosyltransferase family 4 protein [Candidatus Binatia bacterium]|nr:glycosyltransferase family 4 protein [Candidatus Binatia bacterium]
MLRVGYYLNSNAIGGLERHVLTLIERLRGVHHIEVFCDDVPGVESFREDLRAIDIAPRMMRAHAGSTRGVVGPMMAGLPVALAAWNAFKAARLDLVHFHAGQLGFMYAPVMAACAAGIATRILTLHNPIFRHSGLRRSVDAWILRRFSQIVTVSEYMKSELVQKKGVAPERISVIPNGIEPGEFETILTSRQALAELGLEENTTAVGLVGRLHHLKGADLLIEAIPRVLAAEPGVKFVLIGAGPEEQSLRELAEKRRVSGAVRFAGYRRDARRLMPAFKIVVLPSRDEAQSISLLEAMACRKPVVAAAVGGVPEVVDHGVTGLLYPAGNIDALAEALLTLLHDGARRQAMGEAGRQRVADRFSRQTMLRETSALYEAPAGRTSLQPASGTDA